MNNSKNKKAAASMVAIIIGLVLCLLIAGIITYWGYGRLKVANNYLTKLDRQASLEACENLNQNFMFDDLAERIHDPIYNRDGDVYLDSCDLCVGYEDNNGYNMESDNDNDLIHGDCDTDDEIGHDSMSCNAYLMVYSTEDDKLTFTGRCGTKEYCIFLEENDHKSGWGNQELYCDDEND
ncbi:MAG: hypothetical protein KAQ83_04265 [Nanoarchaeota archaeon]|nr:hypothetical protein [Nanoarchaeota archaeon]